MRFFVGRSEGQERPDGGNVVRADGRGGDGPGGIQSGGAVTGARHQPANEFDQGARAGGGGRPIFGIG